MKGILILMIVGLVAQCSLPPPPTYALPEFFEPPADSAVRIAFYNLENLFDTANDPARRDDDFTPQGLHRWTYSRYRAKIREHGQTIRALGGWNGVDIMAVAEIENKTVLRDLSESESLKDLRYNVVHYDSPDPRGIDVALLWNKRCLALDTTAPVPLKVDSGERPLRDLLWCRFLYEDIGFHVIVAHWPSRYGGQMASESKRQYAARCTNQWHDSIQKWYPNELVLFLGDLNDEPHNNALREVLGWDNIKGRWIRLSPSPNDWPGSHVYNGKWNLLDQCYLSRHRTDQYPKAETLRIFPARWLLEETENGSWVPFRTYRGPSYHGGVSDHLPIYFDLYFP